MRIIEEAARGWNQGQRVAVFDAEFMATLPPESGYGLPADEWFDAEIIDTHAGKTYLAKHNYIAYEKYEGLFDVEAMDFFNDAWSVHPYFYGGHWCGCHRATSIECSNPDAELNLPEAEEEHCQTGRFYVVRMWHRSRPDLTLYAEDIPAKIPAPA